MIHHSLGNSTDRTAANLAAQHAAAANVDLSAMSPAFRFGYQDAATRQPFVPEAYFAGCQRQTSYTLGFLTVQPSNHAALSWWMDFLATDAEEETVAADHFSFVAGLGR